MFFSWIEMWEKGWLVTVVGGERDHGCIGGRRVRMVRFNELLLTFPPNRSEMDGRYLRRCHHGPDNLKRTRFLIFLKLEFSTVWIL